MNRGHLSRAIPCPSSSEPIMLSGEMPMPRFPLRQKILSASQNRIIPEIAVQPSDLVMRATRKVGIATSDNVYSSFLIT